MRRPNADRDRAIVSDVARRTFFSHGLPPIVNHAEVASQQLLEILQYAANGQPLDLSTVYEHFTLALGHIAAQRGQGARWFWPDSEPGQSNEPDAKTIASETRPTSRELFNDAREKGDTVGDQWAKAADVLTSEKTT